ncbi:Aste57867_15260 [Aphanomyces stellatus]|uniref:Aste57867_15260 protein n=1 Tax=Aphanomyces stellatus TaxID=120398 RepID=A0A485L300_9STRA|nr:hypothetical protein As57867_015204 [Aphanomyces stellatus]VFT92069.1 Aste57867_15260 [Aphanomyces stellatus]
MRVLVWTTTTEKDQLSVDEDAVKFFAAQAQSKARVVGVLNGDATAADTTLEATKDHQLMLHTMSPVLVTQVPENVAPGKRPLVWMHLEPSSNVVVLHCNNEEAGRLLLVLLSSVVLYSQDSELSFDKLQWIASLPSKMKIRGNQDEAAVAKDLGSHMPRFIWVSRNSKVKWLKDAATGATLSPAEYFDSLLKLDTGFSEASMQANAFKTYLASFFPHREAIMLSRAVDVNAGVDLAWNTPTESLRPAYVAAVEKVFSRFLAPDAGEDTVPVKQLQGNGITFGQFDLLLATYVDALNAHQVPVLANAAAKLIQQSCEAGVAKASAVYADTFQHALAAFDTPHSARALLLAHLKGLSAASLQVFALTQELPSTAATALVADKVQAMHAQIDATYADAVASNLALSQTTCDAILGALNPVAFSSATAALADRSREDFPDGLHAILLGIKNSLQASLAQYHRPATESKSSGFVEAGMGPAMYPALLAYLTNHILDSVLGWGNQVLALFEKHMKHAEDEKDALDNAYEISLASDLSGAAGGFDATDHRKLFEDELAARTDQLANMKSSLSAELEDKRTELERLLMDLRGMQSKHDARVTSVEAEIQRIKAKTADAEAQAAAERSRREQLVRGAASEILSLESNFHAEQKSLYNEQRELLSKVVELERALMGKKTAHLQSLFEMETNCTKAVTEIRATHKKEMQELKTQAKQDISMLKKAYDSKKMVVQQQLDEVNALVKQCEEQLSTLEPTLHLTTPASTATMPSTNGTAPSLAVPSAAAPSPSRGRQDEMCKQS